MIADQIIEKLGMQPHPEGGWFCQTWIGPLVAGRAAGTAMNFLLKAGENSHWHRIDVDEIWHWHAGAKLELAHGIDVAETIVMGPDVLAGDAVQVVVPRGHWTAARSAGAYTLVSCTVSPGFRMEKFEVAVPDFKLPQK